MNRIREKFLQEINNYRQRMAPADDMDDQGLYSLLKAEMDGYLKGLATVLAPEILAGLYKEAGLDEEDGKV